MLIRPRPPRHVHGDASRQRPALGTSLLIRERRRDGIRPPRVPPPAPRRRLPWRPSRRSRGRSPPGQLPPPGGSRTGRPPSAGTRGYGARPPPTRRVSVESAAIQRLESIRDLVRDAGHAGRGEVARRCRAARAEHRDPVGGMPVRRPQTGRCRHDHRPLRLPVRRRRCVAVAKTDACQHLQRVASVGAERLQGIGAAGVSAVPGGGCQHPVGWLGPIGAGIQPQERTRAEGERRHSGPRAALAEERRRLVAEHRRDRRLEAGNRPGGVQAGVVGGPDRREQRPGDAEQVEQAVVPVERCQVDQERPAGVRGFADVTGSARELPGKPAGHIAEAKLAGRRSVAQDGIAFEEPGQLGRREGGVKAEAGHRSDTLGGGILRQSGAQVARPLVLPADDRRHRRTRLGVPEHERLRRLAMPIPATGPSIRSRTSARAAHTPSKSRPGRVRPFPARAGRGDRPGRRSQLPQPSVIGDAAGA